MKKQPKPVYNLIKPNLLRQYKMLIPGLAGEVAYGEELGFFLSRDDKANIENSDWQAKRDYVLHNNPHNIHYVWVEQFKSVFRLSGNKEAGLAPELEKLPILCDSLGNELKEGDKIYYSTAGKKVSILLIEKITSTEHQYDNYHKSFSFTVQGVNLITGSKIKINYPQYSIKMT